MFKQYLFTLKVDTKLEFF